MVRKEGGHVTPAFSRVPTWDQIGRGYLTPAFQGSPTEGDTIRSGHITPAFSGPQKWAD